LEPKGLKIDFFPQWAILHIVATTRAVIIFVIIKVLLTNILHFP